MHHGTYDLTVEDQDISPGFLCHLTRYHFRPNTEPVLRSSFHHSTLYAHPSGAGYAISWESMTSRYVVQFRKANIGTINMRRLTADGSGIEERNALSFGRFPARVHMAHSGVVLAVYHGKFVVLHYL
ncbi:hypothetical protein FB45DRAFT_1040097 [Roridomyces roridus]|uniref:Uncharacterized protein n=1 Tax=Roridomyces roridus TaxID=1738132 RepID=A0AAD7B2B8_9AGAR|nr:hypothetical protein FB45DRAFT_1040097 [Roridomyces roridus]